tara:strand:- start:569 stop:850 length:282 start_codon:yes stop_codon:yes gene_type:complete
MGTNHEHAINCGGNVICFKTVIFIWTAWNNRAYSPSTKYKQQTRKETMENKTIEEVRKNLEESGDVHLQAIARLDHDRLAKLADWIRSLDQKD